MKRQGRRRVPPRLAFAGAENDELFRSFLTGPDDNEVAETYRSLLADASAATEAVERLTRAGCPRIPLCNRLFAVALGHVYRHDPKRTLLGGYDGATLKMLSRQAKNLGIDLDRATKALFGPSTIEVASHGERRERMMAFPRLLDEFATDLRDEHSFRGRVGFTAPPNLSAMYFTGLCDFVYEHTRRDFYGLLGRLIESIVNLYPVSEDSLLNDDDPPERNPFSADAIRQTVKRYRKSVA